MAKLTAMLDQARACLAEKTGRPPAAAVAQMKERCMLARLPVGWLGLTDWLVKLFLRENGRLAATHF